MHELGVISKLIESCERIARQNRASRIGYIKLEIGEASGVVSKYVRTLWAMGTKDTVLDGAELVIEDVRAMVQCEDCGEEFSLMDSADANNDKPCCPKCQSRSFTLVNESCKQCIIAEVGAVD